MKVMIIAPYESQKIVYHVKIFEVGEIEIDRFGNAYEPDLN